MSKNDDDTSSASTSSAATPGNSSGVTANPPTCLPSNPWAVTPGYYTRTDGTVIYVTGTDQFRGQQAGSMSTEVQVGDSEGGGENGALAGEDTGNEG
ncbi:hypothetical protein K458DRAFT_387992 [Lentithecium fluviatile CBS 122367]|uniref:Uncharacterized protein n=1 Tax=Lentithecium fluviatile CBS 122367 TaxID=1168545 RepID=A0A6G1J4P2_9PLEO|nr:hypothetical protein K458DRAFT_387992 [Lentithecium fluviatile CBS 122367]